MDLINVDGGVLVALLAILTKQLWPWVQRVRTWVSSNPVVDDVGAVVAYNAIRDRLETVPNLDKQVWAAIQPIPSTEVKP